MTDPAILADARLFTHDAMNTTFSLRIHGGDEEFAGGLARECFDRLELLESRLSRFIDGSDVSRINHLTAGETLYLSEPCHQCLLLGLDAYARTGGLFDITLGTRIEHRKSGSGGPVPSLAGRLTIHPDVPAITCEEPGREIDLGGIGKGFALDQLKRIFIDWGAADALLTAGGSSLLAIGTGGWPVELTGGRGSLRRVLTNEALSASGTGIQGSHIVHPGGPDAMPDVPCKRIWVTARTAAEAEIWSTALMLLDPGEIPDFIAGEGEIAKVYAQRDGMVEVIR